MGELPLVLFTVLSQMAAGAFITLYILDVKGKQFSLETGKLSTIVIFITTVVSILLSSFHLGHPLGAAKMFTNIGSSWLSREAVLFAVFLILLAGYYTQWKPDKASTRTQLGGINVVIAFLAITASGMIYVLPARPAWNNFAPVLFFWLTAALSGPLFIGTLFAIKGEKILNLLLPTAIVIGIGLTSFLIYTSLLVSSTGLVQATGINMLNSSLFWGKLLLNWLVPLIIILASVLWKKKLDTKLVTVVFLMVLVGEIIGRALFYGSIEALKIIGS